MRQKTVVGTSAWGILVDVGSQPHLHREGCVPALFLTRKAAREDIEKIYGYIRRRPDLRRPPHNWRMPRAIRVTVAAIVEVSP